MGRAMHILWITCALILVIRGDHVEPTGCLPGHCGNDCQTSCASPNCRSGTEITCSKQCEVRSCGSCEEGFWGPYCQYECQPPRTCDSTGTVSCNKADGTKVHCSSCKSGFAGSDCQQAVKCARLEPPRFGLIADPNCLEQEAHFGSQCSLACEPGYQLVGTRTLECSSNLANQCRSDVKTCPDGTLLYRQQNDCTFPACPPMVAVNDYTEVSALGCPMPDGDITPFHSEVGISEDECRHACNSNVGCFGFSWGTDLKPSTCKLFDSSVEHANLNNFLADVDRMRTSFKPANEYPFERYTESCVTGVAIRRKDGVTVARCAFECANQAECRGFQWGYADSSPYYKQCILMSSILIDTICPHQSQYAIYHRSDLDLRSKRLIFESPRADHGSWHGTYPVCEPVQCVEKSFANSKTLCGGRTGDICYPQPLHGYRCAGQVRCEPNGLFSSFPENGFPASCEEPIPCSPAFAKCNQNALCNLRNGTYACECTANYYGNGMNCVKWSLCEPGFEEKVAPTSIRDRVCTDIDECASDNGGCDQFCINSEGSFKCGCADGFELAENGRSCNPSSCRSQTIPNGNTCIARVGEQCSVQCDDGFTPSGALVCESDLSFHGSVECVPNDCQPKSVAYASEPCTGRLGDRCDPSCMAGYKSRGSLLCDADGTFVGHALCEPMECEHFLPGCEFEGKPTDASCGASPCTGHTGLSCDANEYDFTCGNGWQGAGSLTCQARANSIPTFVPVDGSAPAVCKDIDECAVNLGACQQICVNTPGSYHCECAKGFTLQTDGHTCAPDLCEDSLVHSLSMTMCHGRTGDTCRPVGIPGFSCEGIEICQSNGQWTNNATCHARPCEEKRLPGSKIACAGTTGSVCAPVPIPGFNCSGSLTCLPSGIFASMDHARCSAAQCPRRQLQGQNNTCSGGVHSSCIPEPIDSFVCSGFDTCLENGTWAGNATCHEEVTSCSICGESSTCDVRDGKAHCECIEGFWGDGQECIPWSNCTSTQELVAEPTKSHDSICTKSRCKADLCGSNSHCVDYRNGTFGSPKCVCNSGFKLAKDNITCIPKKCSPWKIEGAVTCYGNSSTSCTVRSEAGYDCAGVMHCARDGDWYGTGQCKRIVCPPLRAHGSQVICRGKFGDLCTLKCESLHRPVPAHATLRCQADGSWSGSECLPQSQKSCAFAFGRFKNACGRETRAILDKGPECHSTSPEPEIVDLCDQSCGDFSGVAMQCLGAESGGVSQWQAEAECRRHGARLCTLKELEAGAVFSGRDDVCDIKQVWTSTPCGNSRVWVDLANPAASDVYSRECKVVTDNAFARCCADMDPYPDFNECDCEGCNGLGDCDPVRGRCVNTIGSYQCKCDAKFFTLAPDGKSCILECPFGMGPDVLGLTCLRTVSASHGFKKLHVGDSNALFQTGRLEIPLTHSSTCQEVKFPTSFVDETAIHVFVSATHLTVRIRDGPEALAVWAEDITGDGFRACVSRPDSHSALGDSRAIVSWVVGEESSRSFLGDEQADVIMGRPMCHPISFGPASRFGEPPNHIHLSVYDTKAPIASWVQGVDGRGFEYCVDGKLPSSKQVLRLSWMGQHEPWANKARDVAIGSQQMHEDLCSTRADRAVLASCVCISTRNTTNNATQCISWEYRARANQNTLCRAVPIPGSMKAAPMILATPGYMGSQSRGRPIFAWSEWSTSETFKLCYQVDGDVNLNVGVFVAWTAIVPENDGLIPIATTQSNLTLPMPTGQPVVGGPAPQPEISEDEDSEPIAATPLSTATTHVPGQSSSTATSSGSSETTPVGQTASTTDFDIPPITSTTETISVPAATWIPGDLTPTPTPTSTLKIPSVQLDLTFSLPLIMTNEEFILHYQHSFVKALAYRMAIPESDIVVVRIMQGSIEIEVLITVPDSSLAPVLQHVNSIIEDGTLASRFNDEVGTALVTQSITLLATSLTETPPPAAATTPVATAISTISWNNGDISTTAWPSATPVPSGSIPSTWTTVHATHTVPPTTYTEVVTAAPQSSMFPSVEPTGTAIPSAAATTPGAPSLEPTPIPSTPTPSPSSTEDIPIEDVHTEDDLNCFTSSLDRVLKSIGVREQQIADLNGRKAALLATMPMVTGMDETHLNNELNTVEEELATANAKMKDLKALKHTLEQLVALTP